MTETTREADQRSAVRDQRELDGMQAEIFVVETGAEFWRSLSEWGTSKGLLSAGDERLLEVAASAERKMPSARQCRQVVDLFSRLRDEGCPLEREAR